MNEKLVWFDEPAPPRTMEPLSRERIVAAAVDLADAQANGEITMRTLARELGVRSPMALYRYVGSKDGLADLMADHAYGLITVTGGEGWRPALRALGLSGWEVVQAHPWFARLAFSRPPLGPNAMALYDAALAELDALDLPAATRMGFISTVLGHVLGSGLALLEERTMRAGIGGATDEDLAEAAQPYLDRVAAEGRFPHFLKWFNDPEHEATPPQTFEKILDWLLDGLATEV
ncbi:TetR/AcrR family transcriptional regulator C-terminal domain-containing protein [Amycolatopsis magusensis]|uniref:TetR/AcrR family transcriptional regulator C-terminal domain-containing protein n=1 Tax=Amycolatopsis magusensis TaxID=882444 RepID=UPI0024A80304|nr:TetR/AcrR family transcriptional regulator C-terminal domain-containing protein [Amycolatopsis magusensis]MDI5981683.1 TetR/AcrR family transcriptional regulator C-terminal domain-containing protein [Amycolatopsis magusensis]